MAIYHSYVSLPEGKSPCVAGFRCQDPSFSLATWGPPPNRPNRPNRRRHWISPNLGRLRRRRPARVHTELLETVRWKLSLGDIAGPWT